MRVQLIGAAVIAAVRATPAIAKSDPVFVACDGYDAPKKTADGMNTLRGFLGDTNTSSARADVVPLGAVGLKACEAALADPRLLPDFWSRRAHIYQAMALHQIATSNFAEALKLLDRSDAEAKGRGDVWFDESMGTANRIIRGVALYRLDRKDEGRKALEGAVAARPYATSVTSLARTVETLYEYDRQSFTRLQTEGAPLAPSLINVLFWTAIFHDDYAAAEKLAGQISFDLPKGHGSWRLMGESNYEYDLIKERAQLAAGLAYAKFALGKRDEAKKIMADARDDVADAIEPPQPDADGKPPSKRVMNEWALRKRAGDSATKSINDWEHAMTVRDEVSGKSFAAANFILQQDKAGEIITITDILRQVKPANDAERATVDKIIAQIDAAKDLARRRSFAMSVAQLVARLPRSETVSMRPTMQREGIGILRTDANGFGIKPDKTTGLVTVRFGATNAPRAVVEEASLLKAAQYAREQGSDSFIVTSAQSIQRSITMVGMWSRGQTYDSGYESRLLIRPVDSTKLPADLEPQRWRLIKADEVIARLGPKYLVAAPAK